MLGWIQAAMQQNTLVFGLMCSELATLMLKEANSLDMEDAPLGTSQVLRKQKGGWVGYAKCLHFLTWWVGGSSKMLT